MNFTRVVTREQNRERKLDRESMHGETGKRVVYFAVSGRKLPIVLSDGRILALFMKGTK